MAKDASKGKGKPGINTLPFYILLIVLFALYLLYQHVAVLSYVLGIALFLAFIAVVCLEVLNGVREYGFRKNMIEIVVVVLVVVGIWFALQFFLATKYPLDVVPSCSMLPVLQRGDMLVLHGVSNPSQLKAPVINVSRATYANMVKEAGSGTLSCVAYLQSGSYAQISQFMKPGYTIGLYSGAGGGSVVNIDGQTGPLRYECGVANDTFSNGTTRQIVYTSGITIGNTTISGDRNNSIVVYSTLPQDLFYQEGDGYIVHRAYAVLNVTGSYYVLTKGDNNPGLDVQYNNLPANLTEVQGKVVASIPYLGYLKLILSSRFSEPAGCNSTIMS